MEKKEENRKETRQKEDRSYQPVIIKRIDVYRAHPDDVLERAIEEGLLQYNKTTQSLFLSAVASGLILCFSALLYGTTLEYVESWPYGINRKIVPALFYPLGFILCILSGTQLFTEQTATSVYPVLDRKAHWKRWLPMISLVLAGNLVGTLIGSLLIFAGIDQLKVETGFILAASHFLSDSFGGILISGILAGWLMALGGWLILTTNSFSGQMAAIYIVTFMIGFSGFHHSIAGSSELFLGSFLSPSLDWPRIVMPLFASILGNLIGGSVLVALLNYGHIRHSQNNS